MVKKLFKYEFAALAKTLIPCELGMLVAAALNRIIQIAEPAKESFLYNVPFAISCVALFLAMAAVSVIVEVLIVVRFYKNLYSNEGYLTFTLPVTVDQHLIVKTVTAVCFVLINLVCIFLSFTIVFSGDMLAEIVKAFNYFVSAVAEAVGTANVVFFFIEAFFAILFTLISGILFYYFCLTVGQLAKRHRIALAVGVYLGVNALFSFCWTIFSTVFILSESMRELEELLVEFFFKEPAELIHVVLIAAIVGQAVIGALYYIFTRLIMKRKLNLE